MTLATSTVWQDDDFRAAIAETFEQCASLSSLLHQATTGVGAADDDRTLSVDALAEQVALSLDPAQRSAFQMRLARAIEARDAFLHSVHVPRGLLYLGDDSADRDARPFYDAQSVRSVGREVSLVNMCLVSIVFGGVAAARPEALREGDRESLHVGYAGDSWR